MWLNEGVNLFRVELLWGGHSRIDYVRFVYTGSLVESRTWGRIKSMYR